MEVRSQYHILATLPQAKELLVHNEYEVRFGAHRNQYRSFKEENVSCPCQDLNYNSPAI